MVLECVRVRYPLPEVVGAYGTAEEFARSRKESGQWVHWQDRVELILEGRYDEVKPLHVELSPTFICNFACPWCSCRKAREEWVDGVDVFSYPEATPETVMCWDRMRQVIDALAADNIGIMWVGGEPTMNPATFKGMVYAHSFGLKQCMFTNGSLLHPRRIDEVLASELVFVRFSLDAVSDNVHAIFHGYDGQRTYAERVRSNLKSFGQRKVACGSSTLCGVSVVIDDRNANDLLPTSQFICSVIEASGPGAIDYVIFRPAYKFYTSDVQLSQSTTYRALELLQEGGVMRTMLEAYGIQVVTPSQSFQSQEDTIDPKWGDRCLAAAWFGEIKPTGELVACSDRYGNPEFVVGNLTQESVDQIWSRSRRAKVLNMAEQTQCFKTFCPRNGRGFYFNKLFHQIERFRAEDRIDEVRQWIEDLRMHVPKPEHSFFL